MISSKNNGHASIKRSPYKPTGKKAALLELCRSDTEYSRSEIALRLGTSTSYVYKALCELRAEGYLPALRGRKSPKPDANNMAGDLGHGGQQTSAHQMPSGLVNEQKISTRMESKRSQAFRLLKKGLCDLDIAIRLDISQADLFSIKKQFLLLTGSDALSKAYEEMGDEEEFRFILGLANRRKAQNIPKEKFLEMIERTPRLAEFESKYEAAKRRLETAQQEIEQKDQVLDDLDRKISAANRVYEHRSALNDALAKAAGAHDRRRIELKAEIEHKEKFLKDLEQKQVYKEFHEFIEGEVCTAVRHPYRIIWRVSNIMLEVIRENPRRSAIAKYVFKEPDSELSRMRALGALQDRTEEKFREEMADTIEKKWASTSRSNGH